MLVVFDKSMNMAQTKPTLPRVFFHFSSILNKYCFIKLLSIKLSVGIYMILSKTFDMRGKIPRGL